MKKNIWKIVILLLILIPVIVVITFPKRFHRRYPQATKPVISEYIPPHQQQIASNLSVYKLPEFKLAGGHITHINFIIGLGYLKEIDQLSPEFKEELEEKQQKIREIIYRTVGGDDNMYYNDLDRMEEDCLQKINKILVNGIVKDIIFEKYYFHTTEAGYET